MPSRYADHVLTGTFAARPAATAVPAGTLYASSTDGTVYQSNGTVWATWLAAPAASGVTKLVDTTLGSAAASFDLTSISASYKQLQLWLTVRGDKANVNADVYMRFNGDTAANYDYSYLRGSNSAASSFQSIADALGIWIGACAAATATAGAAAAFIVNIPNYADTVFHKSAQSSAADKRGTTAALLNTYLVSGFWRSTAAINQITVRPDSGNFITGSRAVLYGMA